MADKGFKRKLAAIMSADAVGYSRLMADDEAATVDTIATYREIISSLVKQHRGRVVDSPGDNLLAEFSSVVDAVQCAVAVQSELQTKNAELAENRRMEFRIGINLGDVIDEEDRIYGDGVNIAARLEALADPSGICVSKTAFDQIETKLPLGFKYLGEQSVKNIPKPVSAYRVLMRPEDAGKLVGVEPKPAAGNWIWPTVVVAAIFLTLVGYQAYQKMTAPEFEPASIENMAYPLPDKPSIAVLPFDNMSGDPEEDYIADGISEEIITSLSKTDQLFVTARNSTFTYKNKPVKIKQVAEDLGVRYVLEGSVQKSEDRLRINAQLIDAKTGHHIWAERYDRHLADIFAIQDEITLKIVNALHIKLTEGEQALVWEEKYKNLDLYLKTMKARSLWSKGTKENINRFGQLAQEIIEMAPDSPHGYRLLAWYYWARAMISGISPKESIAKAFELAQKALPLDESDSPSHALLGSIYLLKRDYDKAIAAGERSIELNPNGSLVHGLLGVTQCYAGNADEGIDYLKKGVRLDPIPPYWFYTALGRCYIVKGQYENALTEMQNALQRVPGMAAVHRLMAAIYKLTDRHEEARSAAAKALELDPKFSLEGVKKAWPYKNPADLELLVNAMREAGLPDKPPLPLPDKPSIAVLPFENISGDPEQEYFSDGITEDIITALSKTPKMLVIARNSTFTYKGKPVKIQQVANELGVRYVLEGSVQKVGERVRITAQLVDAKSGHHLWAEKYDRDLKNIFALQDEITKEIIIALQVSLTEGEQARIRAKGTGNLEAYLKALEARELVMRWNIEDNYKARKLYQEALKLDPNYAIAYSGISLTHIMDVWMGATKSKKDSIVKATELIKKGLLLDNYSSYAHRMLASVYYLNKQYEEGILEYEKALELEPNGADALAHLARSLDLIGRSEEAIQMSDKAMRLNPIPPDWYIVTRTAMYRNNQNYEEALIWAKKAVQRAPNNFFAHINLCSIYSLLGQMEKAHFEADECMKLNPKFSLKKFEKTIPYKIPSVKKQFIDALRKAGVPE